MKIAFFDIDGTLVSFEKHIIPESAVKSIDTLRRNGVEVVIATGRGAEGVPYVSGKQASAWPWATLPNASARSPTTSPIPSTTTASPLPFAISA